MASLLDLYVSIKVKDEASKNVETISGKLGRGLATAAKVGTAAVATAAAGVVALTKSAVTQYAEYEQLAGGAKLMFGDAYDYIAEKAKNAYSTVQMSQNDYLQQVNGFATGLKTALGNDEQAAAALAARIVQAEADVVAATGNTQEAVQNAFNGIMKSNYTMLDNLQLGITPTKEGFQEMIDKVNDWNKANGEATNYQIDNLADAQAALLDYIEMQGLAGYAAQEAAGTITGSVASMKAAYENWLVALADSDADLEEKTQQLVDSVFAVAENVMPVVGQIFESIGIAIEEKGPEVFERIAAFFVENLPQLLILGLQLAAALVEGIFSGLGTLAEMLGGWLNEKIVAPVHNVVTQILTALATFGAAAKQSFATTFENIRTVIHEKMEAARETVSNVIERIRALFDFEWSLPHLKLPHVTISGSFSLNPPSVPHFGLEWYAAGGILTQPTMFGFNPFTGNAMIGGEAGAEAIAPISTLQDYVSEAVNGSSVVVLTQILEVLTTLLNGGIPMEIDINNVVEIDGAVTARKLYRFLVDEANRHGPKLIT